MSIKKDNYFVDNAQRLRYSVRQFKTKKSNNRRLKVLLKHLQVVALALFAVLAFITIAAVYINWAWPVLP